MSNMILSPFSSSSRSGGGSNLRKWLDNIGGGPLMRAKPHVTEGGHALRAAGESAVVGAALGYAAAAMPNGLDVQIPTKLTGGKIVNAPIDAVVGVVGMIGAVAMANEGIASDLRNAGATGISIFAYRKTQEYALNRKKMPPSGVQSGHHGEFGEDPILAAARAL